MKVYITTKDEQIEICEEITAKDIDKTGFDVISPNYMVRVEDDGDTWQVVNAVDGWGNNCRERFK